MMLVGLEGKVGEIINVVEREGTPTLSSSRNIQRFVWCMRCDRSGQSPRMWSQPASPVPTYLLGDIFPPTTYASISKLN